MLEDLLLRDGKIVGGYGIMEPAILFKHLAELPTVSPTGQKTDRNTSTITQRAAGGSGYTTYDPLFRRAQQWIATLNKDLVKGFRCGPEVFWLTCDAFRFFTTSRAAGP